MGLLTRVLVREVVGPLETSGVGVSSSLSGKRLRGVRDGVLV